MWNKDRTYLLCILILFVLTGQHSNAQTSPDGFLYQTIVRDLAGQRVINQLTTVKFSLRSVSFSGLLVYQEVQSTSTDNNGLVSLVIGEGVSTGSAQYSNFGSINWSSSAFFLQVSMDVSGGTSFLDYGNTQLFSVPYAFHSSSTGLISSKSLNDFTDADTANSSVAKVLKWNGSNWIPSKDLDSDSVLFAFSTLHVNHSDTAAYVFVNPTSDSVFFSFATDSSNYVSNSQNSISSSNALYSDTTVYALNSATTTWIETGNIIGNQLYYLGTSDYNSLVIKTNNIERLEFDSTSNISLANSTSIGTLSSNGGDGLLASGSIGSVPNPSSNAGTKLLWYPGKASFRAGGIEANQWDTLNIGAYSAAFGYNTTARSYSFGVGFENTAVDYSFVSGRKSSAMAVGGYPEGNSIALGDSCHSLDYRDVTIGKNNYTSGAINVLIGYGNLASSGQSLSMGSITRASGNRSVLLGYKAATNSLKPAFVYSDASSNSETVAPLAFQFVVRAAGGFVFYTDSLNTMGVVLAPGSGSWSVVSDRSKKENLENVEYEEILAKINKLSIKTWNYKSQDDSIRHIGPMAQDFNKQYVFGNNQKMIEGADMDGVILSGIKAINKHVVKLDSLYEPLTDLNIRIKDLNSFEKLNNRLDALENLIEKDK